MRLATLLGCGLAAALLAACSGGGTGSVAPSASTSGAGTSSTVRQGVALRIDAPINLGPTNSTRRSPKFIGSGTNEILYTFTPGPISGSFTETSPGVFSGCSAAGVPTVQTCDVTLAPGTYSVTVTLEDSGTVLGSGTTGGIVITSGNVNNFAVDINPVNSVPSLTSGGGTYMATAFYNDGQAQSVLLYPNELDPVGDIIATEYGPVGNYPTLSYTDSGGTANITLPGSVAVAPAFPQSNQGQVSYTGSGNTTTLTVSLSDGVSSSQVVIPYISLANNANNPSPGTVTFSSLGGAGAQTVTVTETTSGAPASLDSHFFSSNPVPAMCGSHASFSPPLGSAATTVSGQTASVTYTITAVDSAIASCELDVASSIDGSLTTPITIDFPGTLGVGVGSHARR